MILLALSVFSCTRPRRKEWTDCILAGRSAPSCGAGCGAGVRGLRHDGREQRGAGCGKRRAGGSAALLPFRGRAALEPLSADMGHNEPLWATLGRRLGRFMCHFGPLWTGVGRNRPERNCCRTCRFATACAVTGRGFTGGDHSLARDTFQARATWMPATGAGMTKGGG